MQWVKFMQWFQFVCEWGFQVNGYGASRVMNGTPKSLPSGLLTPTVPWLQLYLSIHGYMRYGKTLKKKDKNQWDYENYDTYLVCIFC